MTTVTEGAALKRPGRNRKGLKRLLWGPLLLYAGATLASCAIFPPAPGRYEIDDRMGNFPAEALAPSAPAEIRWSDEMIPFIFAEREEDVPYLMGAAHAHLREAQMEVLRLGARGRLGEIAGPLGATIDRLLRTLDLDRAVDEMASNLPPETRAWIASYVRGVNDFLTARPEPPAERAVLGLGEAEPWTVEDVLAVGRVASVDITWGRLFRDARLSATPESREYLERLRQFMGNGVSSFGPQEPTPLRELLSVGKTGSNSFAVSGDRAAGEGAIIASDPHLGVQQPNLFCVVGYRTPERAVVGMTFPGLPFVVIGRNERIAWGGTNMQALTSIYYDVSAAPAEEFSVRTETLKQRFWFDKTIEIREHTLGPIISDAPFFSSLDLPDTALWWRGHEPSDEGTAFLKVSRAENWEEFRAAFGSYAVSGQNFLFADREGNIGQVMAVEFDPAAGRAAIAGTTVSPTDPAFQRGQTLRSTDLPVVFNPDSGVLASTNNVPIRLDPPITMGGNWNDRQERIVSLLSDDEPETVDSMARTQRDVYLASAHDAARDAAARELLPNNAWAGALESWDGHYRRDSEGASAYEMLAAALVDGHYRRRYGEAALGSLRNSQSTHRFIAEDLTSGAISDETLVEAANEAGVNWRKNRVWGERHRLRVRHPLGAVPILGSRFRFGEHPADGTTGTVYKSAHQITSEPVGVQYGAQSRHVSDMGTLDENFFVLLGGQDGWLGSAHYVDQVSLWQSGEMIRVPLSERGVREMFTRSVRIAPAEQGEEE